MPTTFYLVPLDPSCLPCTTSHTAIRASSLIIMLYPWLTGAQFVMFSLPLQDTMWIQCMAHKILGQLLSCTTWSPAPLHTAHCRPLNWLQFLCNCILFLRHDVMCSACTLHPRASYFLVTGPLDVRAGGRDDFYVRINLEAVSVYRSHWINFVLVLVLFLPEPHHIMAVVLPTVSTWSLWAHNFWPMFYIQEDPYR